VGIDKHGWREERLSTPFLFSPLLSMPTCLCWLGAGAAAMFNSYRITHYWGLLEHPPQGVTINIVRAANSDRWPSH
jgi:hypothetical protein